MRHLIWIGGIFGLTMILGCGSWKGGENRSFQHKIDKLEQYHHYCEIMVSKPIFAKKTDFFKFELGLTAREFYDEVGLQIAGRFGDFDVAGFRGVLNLQAPGVAGQTVQPFGNQMAYAFAETLIGNASADPSLENSAIIADLLKASLAVSLSSFMRGSSDQLGFRVRGAYAPVDVANYAVRDSARSVVLLQDVNIPIVMAVTGSRFRAENGFDEVDPDRRQRRDDVKRFEQELDGVRRSLMQTRLEVNQARQDSGRLALITETSRDLEQARRQFEESRSELREQLKIYIRMDVETRWMRPATGIALGPRRDRQRRQQG